MKEAIIGIVFATTLMFACVTCQSPSWNRPANNSEHILDLEGTNACAVNVLSESLSATSTTSATVYYRIVSQSPDDGTFSIGTNLAGSDIVVCDKEKMKSSTYDVVLGAYYKPRNDNNEATITVKMSLKGLAEPKTPVFSKPNPDSSANNHFIHILETIEPGNDVITLEATDGGDSTGSTFIFNMDKSHVATRQLFEIKEGTNVVKVRDNVTIDYFDAENMDTELTYPIVLEVSNGERASTLSTEIFVDDVNDNAPEFTGTFQTSIPENSKTGSIVLKLNVTDKDKTSPNNKVSLSLSGADEFEINGTDIVVAPGANFTSDIERYTLTVTATDNALMNSKFKTQEITVLIHKDPTNSASRNASMMGAVLIALLVCQYHYL